jgi:hypothetical protein
MDAGAGKEKNKTCGAILEDQAAALVITSDDLIRWMVMFWRECLMCVIWWSLQSLVWWEHLNLMKVNACFAVNNETGSDPFLSKKKIGSVSVAPRSSEGTGR